MTVAENRTSTEADIDSLPTVLAERTRLLAARPQVESGEFVLYWMHHAVRGHENPALDVALTLANRHRLPVVVYQGLGGNHRFDNDRHHTFILQGARDAHAELGRLGIRTLLNLDTTGSARAAAVVVEEFPAPPFPAWTQAFADRSPVSVLAVDSCCILPMQQQPHRFTRAYEFRRHNKTEFDRRVPLTWPVMEPIVPAFNGLLDAVQLPWETADCGEICAQCSIDHSIPPVAHTRGGSIAGYQRWDRFRRDGLQNYARFRYLINASEAAANRGDILKTQSLGFQ